MSPQASGSRSPSRHSPIPPARSLHTSRSFSATSPLKSSAFSDRDASGHLDFKRLMSKPAKQSASASSMVSLPSDSERSASALSSRFPTPGRRPSEPLVRPALKSASPSREKLSLHVNTSGLRSSSATTRAVQGPSPEHRPGTSDGQPSKSSRNVLKRRPSSRSNPSTPIAGQFQTSTDESYAQPRSTSSKRAPRSERLTTSFSARPTTSPATNRAATLPRKTSLTAAPRSQQYSPSGLTPAGAVALAYKQQELRREELAETASFNDAYRPASANPSVQSMRRTDAGETDEEGGEPYYTVFGSSSGKLIAVGSPVDDDWHVTAGWETRASVAAPKSVSTSSRSLSRKVSGSIKRVTESMKREREARDPLARARGMDDWTPYDGSRSVGGRESPTRQKVGRKPPTLDMHREEQSSPRASPIPLKGSPPAGSLSPQEDGRGSRAPKPKTKEELSPGGMWSKLMKRISTGGLRDKYTQSDEPPPPVPALPQNLVKTAAARTTMDISHAAPGEVSENGVLLKRFMQSRSSLSGVRPSAASTKAASSSSSRPSTGTAGRPSTGNTTKSRGSLGQRPSTRTRSSSPVSSEVASSGFFNHNRTPSTRSSFSSLGEELPPMPRNLGRYIVPPGELSRMAKASEQSTPTPSTRSRKSSRSQTAPMAERASPFDGVPSLPLPPRRATHEGASPMSPAFHADAPTSPPCAHPPPLAEFGMAEPPPRPKRSSRRMPPPNVDVPPRSQSMSATMPRSPATPRGQPPVVRVDVSLARSPSTGALSYASTARQVSATSSTSPSSGASLPTSPGSAVSSQRSPLTFRELESPRHKLSEREKAAKWEDLLERSALAGGTLRVGEPGLLSEHPDVEGASIHTFDDL
ncbi:hypothetical protein TRAPUB_11006 [Trametes pubescens]|uniref:Uncharacterized protein n=1 Tax=Trametes pubescens TaxID=154538 RepID=A0A1M2VXT7_TRAPU|nr:hypothetical protein TRAPUB_11006 [Trametes pubescens]